MSYKVIKSDCRIFLKDNFKELKPIDLTFLDPPFNQNKNYALHNDDLPEKDYWKMMDDVCKSIFKITSAGGAIYFMQREKNTEFVLRCLKKAKWTFQNLIIWKKKTSAVPCSKKYGKHYQVIAFATKGEKARVFNKLRISPPLPANYKFERENGIFVTDIWDDIRELTSGYLAGDEALRNENGERFHKQQAPISLLLRIILSSSNIGDTVFDPFAGTGTTLTVANQLNRQTIGIELDPRNIKCIENRLSEVRDTDNILKFHKYYQCTKNLKQIWDIQEEIEKVPVDSCSLFNF
ncbi:MAG: site-specific DNA-methyltransferase [Elusimicrobia bacterium]|nr:site-specific DNA-methyltransferase [Elusimicrobiota bacterium]